VGSALTGECRSGVHWANGPPVASSTASWGSRTSRYHSAMPRTGSSRAASQLRHSASSRLSASAWAHQLAHQRTAGPTGRANMTTKYVSAQACRLG